MRFYFDFLGCRLNEAEIANWRRAIEGRGELVDDPEIADVITLNTCAVTGEAARKSRRSLRQFAKKNPNAHLIATGCYATLEPQKTANLLGVDMVIENSDKDLFLSKVSKALAWGAKPKAAMSPNSQPAFSQNRTRAFVKVQDGCRNKCSYCIVTIARGREKSRKIDEICAEINHLSELGYQEVVLAGVHLGGYGTDIGVDLKTLVENILNRTSIPRLRIGSLEPWDLPNGFFSLWNNSRLCPHLHLPLQSGSDTVLKRMIRRCTVSQYTKLIADARQQNPDFHISSDIIVGFPGETEEEFDQTMKTVEKIAFGDLHLFRYSPRQGTAAARMKGHVDKAIAAKRHLALKNLGERLKRARLESLIGKKRRVLWERETERDEQGQLIWSGYTEDYHRATLKSNQTLFNQITETNIYGISNHGRLLVNADSTNNTRHSQNMI